MRIVHGLGDYVVALIARVRRALVHHKKFRTGSHFCGQCYLPNLDNAAEVLAAGRGRMV